MITAAAATRIAMTANTTRDQPWSVSAGGWDRGARLRPARGRPGLARGRPFAFRPPRVEAAPVRNKQTEETFRNEDTAQSRTASAGRVLAGLMAGHEVADLSLPPADNLPCTRGMTFIEGLTGLRRLPRRGSWFLFLPLRLVGGPGRALAVLPESA
jgi:hypothetical protein